MTAEPVRAAAGGPWRGQSWVLTGAMDDADPARGRGAHPRAGRLAVVERQQAHPHRRRRRLAGHQAGACPGARRARHRRAGLPRRAGRRGRLNTVDGVTTQTASRRARLLDNPELLRERLRAAPTGAGVYVMRDLEGRVAYVGKAASLRNRLRSYFTRRRLAAGPDPNPGRARLRLRGDPLPQRARGADPREQPHQAVPAALQRAPQGRQELPLPEDPQAGCRARRTRPAPRASSCARRAASAACWPRSFPRPYYTRRIARDGARYFGPYTSAQSLRSTVKSLRTIFPFRTCSDEIFRRGRVCLDYHIKRCSGPCEGRIDAAEYATLLDQVELFMQGRSDALEAQLRRADGGRGRAARLRAGRTFPRPPARHRPHRRAPEDAHRLPVRPGLRRGGAGGRARDGGAAGGAPRTRAGHGDARARGRHRPQRRRVPERVRAPVLQQRAEPAADHPRVGRRRGRRGHRGVPRRAARRPRRPPPRAARHRAGSSSSRRAPPR